jgi:hypothetical protein
MEKFFVIFVGGLGLISIVAVIANEKAESPEPKSGFEIVRVCKAPLFRRPTDYVGKKDGKLFYVTRHGALPVADESQLKEICKKS